MNLDKSDVKVGTANEIGCRLDDMLEASVKDLHRFEGAVTALRAGTGSLESLEKAVDKDLDEGLIENLETAALLKKWLGRARQVLTNLAMQADNNRLLQTGRITAMQAAVDTTKKFREEEMARAATLRAALETNKTRAHERDHVVAAETPSTEDRPGLSIKERRLAEEFQAKPAALNGVSQKVKTKKRTKR